MGEESNIGKKKNGFRIQLQKSVFFELMFNKFLSQYQGLPSAIGKTALAQSVGPWAKAFVITLARKSKGHSQAE